MILPGLVILPTWVMTHLRANRQAQRAPRMAQFNHELPIFSSIGTSICTVGPDPASSSHPDATSRPPAVSESSPQSVHRQIRQLWGCHPELTALLPGALEATLAHFLFFRKSGLHSPSAPRPPQASPERVRRLQLNRVPLERRR